MSSSTPDDRSAGASPAVAGATRPRFGEITIRERGRLPHWEKDNATYFVTFRLADSLPRTVLDRIASERASIMQLARQQSRELTPSEQQHLKRSAQCESSSIWTLGQVRVRCERPRSQQS
jgi:hypothetical protein